MTAEPILSLRPESADRPAPAATGPSQRDPALRRGDAATGAGPVAVSVAAPAVAPITVLHRLLDTAHAAAAESPGGLTDHGPMALQALWALGADPQRLEAFAAARALRWRATAGDPEPAGPEAPPAGPDDLWALFGRGPQARLRACLEAAARRDGLDGVVQRLLPRLASDVAAVALHGPIRVAHALAAGHAGELLSALAYWAWRWHPLPEPEVAAGAEVAGAGASSSAPLCTSDWLAALEACTDVDAASGGLITARIAQASRTPAYRRLAGRLRVDGDTLPTLRSWAAAAYAASGDFTLLHLVTGLRAVAQLQRACPAIDLSASLPRAVTAAWLSVAASRSSRPPRHRGVAPSEVADLAGPGEPHDPWPALRAAAIAQDDDHVIKLVQACDASAREGLPGPWSAAARRALPGR